MESPIYRIKNRYVLVEIKSFGILPVWLYSVMLVKLSLSLHVVAFISLSKMDLICIKIELFLELERKFFIEMAVV